MINSSSSRRKRQTELESMRHQGDASLLAPSRSVSALVGAASSHHRSPGMGAYSSPGAAAGRTASTSAQTPSFPKNSDRAAVYLNRQLFTPPPLRQQYNQSGIRPVDASSHNKNNLPQGSSSAARRPSDASRFLFSASADGRSRNYSGNGAVNPSSADRPRAQLSTANNNKENVTPRYHAPTLRQVIQPGELSHSGLTPRKRVVDATAQPSHQQMASQPAGSTTQHQLPSYIEPRFVQWTFPTWAVGRGTQEEDESDKKKPIADITNGRRCCVFCQAGEAPHVTPSTTDALPSTLESNLLQRHQRIQDVIGNNKQKGNRTGGPTNQKVVVVQNDKKAHTTKNSTSDGTGMGEVVSLLRLGSCNHYCCRKCAVANSRVVWRSGATEQLQEIVSALSQQHHQRSPAAPPALTSKLASFASPASPSNHPSNVNSSGIRSSPSARNLMYRASADSPRNISPATTLQNGRGSGMNLNLAERLPSYSGGGGSVVRSGSGRFRLSAANFGTPLRGDSNNNYQHESGDDGGFKSPQVLHGQQSSMGTLILSPEHHCSFTPITTNASLNAIKVSLLDESHNAALTPRTKVSIASRSPHLNNNSATANKFTSTFLHSNATKELSEMTTPRVGQHQTADGGGLSPEQRAANTSDMYKPLLKLLSKSVLRDADHAQMLPILEQFTTLTRPTESSPVAILTKDEAAMLLMKLVKRTEVRCSQCSCCDEFFTTISTTTSTRGHAAVKVIPSYLVDPVKSISAHIPPPEDVFLAACHIVSAVQPTASHHHTNGNPSTTMELVPHNSTLCDTSSIKMHLLETKAWSNTAGNAYTTTTGHVPSSPFQRRISLPPLCSHSVLDRSEGGAAYVALLVAQHHHQLKEKEATNVSPTVILSPTPTSTTMPDATASVLSNIQCDDGDAEEAAVVSTTKRELSVSGDVDNEEEGDNSPPHVSHSRDHSPEATSLNVSVIEADDLLPEAEVKDDEGAKNIGPVSENVVEEGSRDRRSNTMPPGSPDHSPNRNQLPQKNTNCDDNDRIMATSTIPHLPLYNFSNHNGPTDTISPRRSQIPSSPTTARTSTSNRNGTMSTPRLLTPMRMPRTARTMYQSSHVPECTPMYASGGDGDGTNKGNHGATVDGEDDGEAISTIPHQLLAAFTTHRTPLSMWNSATILPNMKDVDTTTSPVDEGDDATDTPVKATFVNELNVDDLKEDCDDDHDGGVETVEVGSPYHVSLFSESGFFPGSPSVIGTEGDNANDEDRSDSGSPVTKTVRGGVMTTGADTVSVEALHEEGAVAAPSSGPTTAITADNDEVIVEITPPQQQEASFPETPPVTVEVADLLLAVEVVSTNTSLDVSFQHSNDGNGDAEAQKDEEENSIYQLPRVVSALKKPSANGNTTTNVSSLRKTVSFSGVARREVSIEGSAEEAELPMQSIPAYEPRRFWDEADAEETNERLQHYRDMLQHTVTEAMERAVMRVHISSVVAESRLRRTASAPESTLRRVNSSLHDIDDEVPPCHPTSSPTQQQPLELQPLDQTHTQRALRRLLAEKRAEEARRVADAAARGRRLREDPRSLRMHVFDTYNRTHARGGLMPATAEVVPAGHAAQYSIVELNYIDEDEDEDSEIEALDRTSADGNN